jgi:GNAT superfamily N-acetyltransferase
VTRTASGTSADLLLRDMTAADIPAGLRLCRASGWNQLENDWRVFLEWNPSMCRAVERTGSLVGTVAALRFGDCFSWLSMVLVHPSERGGGIGTRLLDHALTMLSGQCVRLDATPLGQPIYARNGFHEEYPLSRMTASVECAAVPVVPRNIRPMHEQDLAAVFAYDRAAFGADRSPLLQTMFHLESTYAWIAGGAEDIQGYCFGRPGFLYQQIGPVVAASQQIASNLISACLTSQGGRKFCMDVPHFDPEWLASLEQMGFSTVRSFVRMCRGENKCPGMPAHMYAIAGPEFG